MVDQLRRPLPADSKTLPWAFAASACGERRLLEADDALTCEVGWR
jgi:hypothetical protein